MGPWSLDRDGARDVSLVATNLGSIYHELVCNLPGHYAAGMYTQLTVR